MARVIVVLMALLVSTTPVTAAVQQAAPADNQASLDVQADYSTWFEERPLLPPESADLQTGEPTYEDDGSGTADSPTDVATDEPSDAALDTTGLVTTDVEALATTLGNDPRAIFEWVRNNIEFEPYYVGVVKGAQETLDQRAGNDMDSATLLVALLRSGGTPARFVQRQIKVPAADAASWIGVQDPLTAAFILAASGLPVTVAMRSGSPVALLFDHVWVEAYVPEGGGKAWKALDPSYKLHTIRPGRNVMAEAGMTGLELRDALLSASSSDGPSGRLNSIDTDDVNSIMAERRDRLVTYLETSAPGLTLNDVVGGTDIVQETVAKLPTRPPYGGRGSTTRVDNIADSVKQMVRFRTFGIDTTLRLSDIADKKVTLGFVPATAADQAEIDAAGGILNVAPASVDLKPQLRVAGAVVAEGSPGPIGFFLQFGLEFRRGSALLGTALHVVSIGGTYAVALDTQNVPVPKIERSRDRLEAALAANKPVLGDEITGEVLHALGLGYFRFNDLTTEYLAGTQNAVAFQQVSEALVGQDLVFDNSVSPARMAIGGYSIDVKRQVFSLYDSAGDPAFETFPLLYTMGSVSSSFEHIFLDLMLGWPGVSTMELLNEGANEQVRLQGVGPENVSAVLPGLAVSSSTKSSIQSAVNSGLRVIVPQRTQRVSDWRGDGWIEYDGNSGAAAYLLSGRLGGGAVILDLSGLPTDQQEAIRRGDASALTAFLDGLILGDFNREGYDDLWLTLIRAGGQLVSGIFVVGDLRDAAAAIQKLKDSGFTDGWADLGLSLIGIIPLFGDAVRAARGGSEVIIVALKNTDNADDAARAFDEVIGVTSEAVVQGLRRSADDGVLDVSRGTLDGLATTTARLTKNGVRVEVQVVGDGGELLRRAGVPLTDGSLLNRGLAGERVADQIGDSRGWVKVDTKVDPTQRGLDNVYFDPATGRYKVIEAKFYEGGNTNFPPSRMNTEVGGLPEVELADNWIYKSPDGSLNDAIFRSVEEGSLSESAAEQLRRAFEGGFVDKELIVVKNNYDGWTIADTFGSHTDLGTGSPNPITVTMIEIGRVLPLAP
jgi:hypothetical protein